MALLEDIKLCAKFKIEPATMQQDLISTNDAAKILGVSASRVRQLIIEGRLDAVKIGRDRLLSKESVEKFATIPRERTGRPKSNMS